VDQHGRRLVCPTCGRMQSTTHLHSELKQYNLVQTFFGSRRFHKFTIWMEKRNVVSVRQVVVCYPISTPFQQTHAM
jgi:hypothetical protein